MRQEAIDYILRNKLPLTEKTISQVLESNFNSKSLHGVIDKSRGINLDMIEDVYRHTSGNMRDIIERRNKLEVSLNSIHSHIQERADSLLSSIRQASTDTKLAKALEKNMSGEITTLDIDLFNYGKINQEETSATVYENIIYGTPKNVDLTDTSLSKMKLNRYGTNQVSLYASDFTGSQPVRIEKFLEGKSSSMDEEDGVINGSERFRINCESQNKNSKTIELIIDRNENDTFNIIEFALRKATMCNIFLSDNDIEYKQIFKKKQYIKNTVLPIGSSSSRYIKILFYVNKHTKQKNGKNIFTVDIDGIYVINATHICPTIYETNPIDIEGSFSGISISTEDNFSDKDVSIKYMVSVNDNPWKLIRPVDKTKPYIASESPIVRVDNYYTNKMVVLSDFTKTESGEYESVSELPTEFIGSNQISVYSKEITSTGEDWTFDGVYYTAYGYLAEMKTLDLGQSSIEINGKWTTGKTVLSQGIHKIRIQESNYANIMNLSNLIVIDGSGETILAQNSNGDTVTIFDPLYPYNHKRISDTIFDHIFKNRLTEKDSYNIHSNGTGFKITTSDLHEEVIICYRLHIAELKNIRIRAEMMSENGSTVPYIEKIILRAS